MRKRRTEVIELVVDARHPEELVGAAQMGLGALGVRKRPCRESLFEGRKLATPIELAGRKPAYRLEHPESRPPLRVPPPQEALVQKR